MTVCAAKIDVLDAIPGLLAEPGNADRARMLTHRRPDVERGETAVLAWRRSRVEDPFT